MATLFEADAKALHEDIARTFALLNNVDTPTVVTIASLHSGEAGQWIIGDDKQDVKLVAKRLRLCADILEQERGSQTPTASGASAAPAEPLRGGSE